jgi:sugar phosphate isomerase/epimerase
VALRRVTTGKPAWENVMTDALPLSGRMGAQMYMFSDRWQTDLRSTLAEVRAIGFRELEIGSVPGIDASPLRAELDRAGLACTSCHIGAQHFFPGQLSMNDPSSVIDYAHFLGADNVVIALLPVMKALSRNHDTDALLRDMSLFGAAIGTLGKTMLVSDWLEIADTLNHAGALFKDAGLHLGFHNHNIEFVVLHDGRTAFDLLVAHTDPALVQFELDIGWAAAAGLDVAALIERHAGRIAQVHLKDAPPAPPDTEMIFTTGEPGAGVQDWPALLHAIVRTPVRHIYVEQDPPFAQSGLASAAAAYEFIQPRLAEIEQALDANALAVASPAKAP